MKPLSILSLLLIVTLLIPAESMSAKNKNLLDDNITKLEI